MANSYLTRTPSSASNRKTFTWSGWIKKSNTTDKQQIFGVEGGSDNTTWSRLLFLTSEKLSFEAYNDTIITNRLFRDASAWYHIVLAVDTTQSTASDRVKLYVNGVQETSFSEATYPSQNQNLGINNTVVHNIGRADGSNAFDGLMTHVNFVDGTALTPTSFGQSDSNGVWIPKPSPSVTYGTNGFFLKMDNSGNMGLDSGGGSNNFTTSGTITQAKDTPSNVFATFNPLYNYISGVTFDNGNTQYKSTATSGGPQSSAPATIAVTSGKYYAEILLDTFGGANPHIGVCPVNLTSAPYWGEGSGDIPMITHGVNYNSASGGVTVTNTSQGTFPTFTSGDYIGIALDMDNERVYFSKNGTWINSANPSSGTGYFDFSSVRTDTNEEWVIGAGAYGGTIWRANFGNGYFGTTAVTSAGANASGNGIFEYDVPTGYTALSTKGLDS
jgi:hypothetical protein